MRSIILISSSVLLLFATSCFSKKMVKSIGDAKKLEIDQRKFIGKPLILLLNEIRPNIRLVYGNPENNSYHVTGATAVAFTFVTRKEFGKQYVNGKKPVVISIDFEVETKNNRKPFPKGGIVNWTKKESEEYGDMIIRRIRVTGLN